MLIRELRGLEIDLPLIPPDMIRLPVSRFQIRLPGTNQPHHKTFHPDLPVFPYPVRQRLVIRQTLHLGPVKLHHVRDILVGIHPVYILIERIHGKSILVLIL